MKADHLTKPKGIEAIDTIWRVELDGQLARYGCYYLPDNYSEIILILKGSLQRLVVGTRQEVSMVAGKCYLAPARSKGTVLHSDRDTIFFVLKVRPNMHNAIISNREFDVHNDVKEIDLSNYADYDWQQALLQMNERFLLKRLFEYLEDQYKLSERVDPIVEDCMGMIKAAKGSIKVKDLNKHVSVCKSTLEEKFHKELGLSPKEFCKIEKINYFMSNYQRYCDHMTLTQLTFKSGYYDQSHLIKEFRYFVDLSPRKYLREVNKLDLRTQPKPVVAALA